LEDLIIKFMELLIFFPYIKDEKVKVQRFIIYLPYSYKDRIKFDNPKTLNEVLEKEMICYDQYKQQSDNPKAWREKKQDKLNQRKNGFNPSPFQNMTKGYQEQNFHRNTPQV
jgi:hypothetical protein